MGLAPFVLPSCPIVRLTIAGGRRFELRVLLPWALAACVAACGGGDECGHAGHGDSGAGALRVEIGTVGGEGNLEVIPLAAGGDIPLETFGQGGTHATVAVRAFGLGTNRAFIDVTVENLQGDGEVSTVPSRRPQLWLCDEAREVCDYLPVHVMTGGLADPDEKDGLRVRISAAVRTEDGLAGEGSQEGVLRKAFDDSDSDAVDGGLSVDGGA